VPDGTRFLQKSIILVLMRRSILPVCGRVASSAAHYGGTVTPTLKVMCVSHMKKKWNLATPLPGFVSESKRFEVFPTLICDDQNPLDRGIRTHAHPFLKTIRYRSS
jgi:hypothetical protein